MERHTKAVDSLEEILRKRNKYFSISREVPTYKTFKLKRQIGQQDLITTHTSHSGKIYVTSWEVKTNYTFSCAYRRARQQAANFYEAMKKYPHVVPRFVLYHTRTGYHRIKKEDC